MFAKLKIPKALLDEGGVCRVTDTQARQLGIVGPSTHDMQGIAFPYLDQNTGDITTLRVRRDYPETKNGKPDGKYLCPKGASGLYIHPRSAAKLKNLDVRIVLVEAEKSALALTAWGERQNTDNDLIPIAMGGCWGWSQEKKALPALLEMCKGHSVYILLDSNAATNPDVKEAQSTLAAELSTSAYACREVFIASLPQLDGVNGPDDLIALENGDDLLLDALIAATPADPLGVYSDDALALEFTETYGDDLRYVDAWGRWLLWNGACWQHDDTLSVYDKARKICRDAAEQCSKKQTAQRIRSAQTVAAVERLARADRRHAATIQQWDADPWLLNTPAGVIDLHTGETRAAEREDYCTKITTVAPGGDCPQWRKVLTDITAGDKDLQRFLQRMCGYVLTGLTRDQALFFLYGTGANGKGVFVNTIAGLMGDYAKTAPIETFIASHNESHPTDLAGLHGARMVSATETEDGRRWAESKIKALTGGDAIAARFMRQDFFKYTPQFKLVISGNHRPGLRSVDEAMRRRMNLVPFSVTIPADKRDPQLTEKLRKEWGGILAWTVEGCLMWQKVGLMQPKAVSMATESYLAAEDALGRWLDECTVKSANAKVESGELFRNWCGWAANAGEYLGSQKRFSQNLEARGYAASRTKFKRVFVGLRLATVGEVTDVTRKPNSSVREFSKGKNKLSTGKTGSPVTSVTPKKFTRAGRRLPVIEGGRRITA
ncbi:MAG: phage/plasmid primase, P4 family [Terracidiphilus sp.]